MGSARLIAGAEIAITGNAVKASAKAPKARPRSRCFIAMSVILRHAARRRCCYS
ncbi:hypothetical protein HMPREF0591_2279 [Mycobacterium parascrofulaceum ATCC BAA-614]|uniref:Uncharacterized protein n=1 Tax=Mycobacterium parascrofulaceum ATCC BAA-614 TaxID=525368 RepID=D5P7Y5_9MYCO|nr:hypothetical protein HMPREF0591_2279 [Mycobacterium parascrofulaceum ATCC BAA-614]